MSAKQPLEIKAFSGINSTNLRHLGQFASGKNFYTKGGILYPRSGSAEWGGKAFSGSINSLMVWNKPGIVPRLLVHTRSELWAYNVLEWEQITGTFNGNTMTGANHLGVEFLATGSSIGFIDLESGNYFESVTPTNKFDKVAVWKFRVFGWGYTANYSSYLWLCGYDADGNIDRTVWPADFFVAVGEDAGDSIQALIPFQNHALVLKELGVYTVYGNDEEDFEISSKISNAGVHSYWAVARVGNLAIWYGDEGVYAYAGGGIPYKISAPIDHLLKRSYPENVAVGTATRFYLSVPDRVYGKTTLFVYDIEEKEWYVWEYPYVITSMVYWPDDDYILAGTWDGKIYRLNTGTKDGIKNIVIEGELVFTTATDIKIKRIWGTVRTLGNNDETFDDAVNSAKIWTITNQGGTGTQVYSNGESILTPQENTINSVSMRASGSFSSVKVNAKLVSDGVNANKYADICIGSGTITGINGANSWWHSVLSNGYVMSLQTEGNASGLIFYRMDNGTSVFLGEGQSPTDWHTQYHDYQININNGVVQFLVDGVNVGSFNDSTYESGDILISQGEYANGVGAILHINNVSATPNIFWKLNLNWSIKSEKGTRSATGTSLFCEKGEDLIKTIELIKIPGSPKGKTTIIKFNTSNQIELYELNPILKLYKVK